MYYFDSCIWIVAGYVVDGQKEKKWHEFHETSDDFFVVGVVARRLRNRFKLYESQNFRALQSQ